MDTKLYKKFVEVEAKYKKIEAEREALRKIVVETMQKEKIEKEENAWGTFTVAHKSSWKYTDAIVKMAEKVKLAQLKEQKSGKAVESVTNYLRFTPVVEEKYE